LACTPDILSCETLHPFMFFYDFSADRTYVTVELKVRLSSVCLFVVCHKCIVAKR